MATSIAQQARTFLESLAEASKDDPPDSWYFLHDFGPSKSAVTYAKNKGFIELDGKHPDRGQGVRLAAAGLYHLSRKKRSDAL
jgi:hypothetical protein